MTTNTGNTSPCPAPPRFTGWRKWALRLALLSLAPAVLFAILELTLRLAGYGHATSYLIPTDGGAAYRTNDRFGWRFFPRSMARQPEPLVVPHPKPDGTYRIFVLGSSAAQGVPDPAYSFSRILEVMLQEHYPGARFEVHNTAMTAINSHVVLPIARDGAHRQPDAFVIYMGNNEVVGPFGAGTVFQRHTASLSTIRAGLWLKSTRTGQLLGDLSTRLRGGEKPASWGGMAMFLERRVPADDPRLDAVYRNYRANLTDICRVARDAGAAVVLCTVPTNLRDCPPFASMHRADLDDGNKQQWEASYRAGVEAEGSGQLPQALEQYLAAASIDARYAELHFRMGRCFLSLGETDQARDHFVLARDLDALRFRADSCINGIVRAVAAADDRLRLVDAEAALAQAQFAVPKAPGIPGAPLFHEHVHLTFEGNYLLARQVFQALQPLLPESIRQRAKPGTNEPANAERCAELLALTPWDRLRLGQAMASMTARPPFTAQLDHTARRAAFLAELGALAGKAAAAPALDEALLVYNRALARRPDDYRLRLNLIALLGQRRDFPAAVEQCQTVGRMLPFDTPTRVQLGTTLIQAGRSAEAMTCLLEVEKERPDVPEVHKALGDALLMLRKTDEAAARFRTALELRPDYAGASNNLAAALQHKGDVEGAARHYRQSLDIEDDPAVRTNLGNLLAKQGRFDQAVEQYAKADALAPHDAQLQNNYGAALLALGQVDAAIEHLKRAVAAHPRYDRAHNLLGQAYEQAGRTAEAIDHYRQAMAANPSWPSPQAGLAWLLATAKQDELRHGAEAVRLAEQACRATNFQQVKALDALAAAYAETGRFPEALRWAGEAAGLAERSGQADLAAVIRQRAALYAALKPYRLP